MTDVVRATEASIEAATHLTALDKGAIEALLALARKIDAWDQIVEWAMDDAAESKDGRPKVPQNDNVSISAYLKGCEQLGLTPSGRKALDVKVEEGGGGSSLGDLQAKAAQRRKRSA